MGINLSHYGMLTKARKHLLIVTIVNNVSDFIAGFFIVYFFLNVIILTIEDHKKAKLPWLSELALNTTRSITQDPNMT